MPSKSVKFTPYRATAVNEQESSSCSVSGLFGILEQPAWSGGNSINRNMLQTYSRDWDTASWAGSTQV